MKKIWRRLLALFGIFVVAAAAFAFTQHFEVRPEEEEPEYEVFEGAGLPVIFAEIGGQQVNILHGYREEVDTAAMEDTVMPVDEDGKLSLRIDGGGSQAPEISWEVRTRDNAGTVAEGTVTNAKNKSGLFTFTLELGEYLLVDRDYRLQLTLGLADGRQASYYTRVRMGEALREKEMVEFVMDFHEATFDRERAESYAVNLENNAAADNGTLADVSIHSSFKQLTWGDLAPKQTGETVCSIQEIDGRFGSFLLEYEVEAEDAEGHTDRYLVDEYFSVQWSSTRFYLMNYQRSMTELFQSDDGRFAAGSLDFGIVAPEDVRFTASPEGGITAFTVAGELWSYRRSGNEITRIFTFRDESDPVRSGYRHNGVKTLAVEENGDVAFLVYGYMNRGRHEGQMGISYLRYEAEANALSEVFFLTYDGAWETLKSGVETLASMSGSGQVCLMAGDTVYSIDWEGGEVVVLADQAAARNFVVNDSQTAIAWELGTDTAQADSVQILYLDTGDSQLVGADSGDWVSPQGFIDEDCILGFGHTADTAVAGAVSVKPYYAIVIQDRSGTEATRYEYDSIYISSVSVAGGQIVLERMEKNGGSFSVIESDTLIQNNSDRPQEPLTLTSTGSTEKGRVWLLMVNPEAKEDAKADYHLPEKIRYAAGESIRLPAASEDEPVRYYAFGEGRLAAVTPEAGTAIAAVYEKMGTVTDSEGRLIWYRTGRQQSVSFPVEASQPVSVSDSMKECLRQMLLLADADTAPLQKLADGMSPMEAMETVFGKEALNLTGSHIRALLYYLDAGSPVAVVDADGAARLLVGYDQYNVEYFDPVTGNVTKKGLQDAADELENGRISCLSYLPED